AAAAGAGGDAVFIVEAVEEGADAECAAAVAAGSGGAWKTALTMMGSFAVIGVGGPALRP
ncbi:hypothetical protein, partial [Paracidovorax cattleyae]|uniref:hypothetical protein n=1 Tax=Paracidovorax cattleyae TaxID=80868 RepID=UPI001A13549E